MESKKSALFFVFFNFAIKNSIPSIVPIGLIILLSTFILERSSFSNKRRPIPNHNWTFLVNIGGTFNEDHLMKGGVKASNSTSILSYFTHNEYYDDMQYI